MVLKDALAQKSKTVQEPVAGNQSQKLSN